MNTRFTSLVVVSAMSVASVASAAAKFSVKVQPAAELPVVVKSKAGLEKVLTKTDAKGRAVATLGDVANKGKLDDYQAEVQQCGDSQEVVIAERGTEPEDGCKKVAGFLVELSSAGIGVATGTAIGAGGAGAGLAAAYFLTHGDNAPANNNIATVTNASSTPGSGTTVPPTPSPSQPQPTTPAGTYSVVGTPVSNSGCSLFNGMITEVLVVQQNPTASSIIESGAVAESFAGAIQSNGAFDMQTTGAVNGGTYRTEINGQFNANSVNFNQTFTFDSVPGCSGATVTYAMSGNKAGSSATASLKMLKLR